MGFLQRILSRVSVLTAIYREAGGYELSWYLCHVAGGEAEIEREEHDILPAGWKKELAQHPVVVLVGGHGVIGKEVATSASIVGQVTLDPEHFLWSFSDGERQIAFVRRAQLEALLQALDEASVRPAAMECAVVPEGQVDRVVSQRAAAFVTGNVTVRNMIRPTAAGSSVALLLGKKAQLPVLGVFLVLLVGNVLVGNDLREKYQRQHARIQALQADRQKGGEREEQNRQMMARMGRALPYRYALLCDRVAAQLPEKVTLTRLAVQPLQKTLENNTPPVIAERAVEIRGEAASSDEIARYVSALGGTPFGKNLKLSSVARNRESELFVFRIDLAL